MSVSLTGYVTQTADRVNINRDTTTQDFQLEPETVSVSDHFNRVVASPAIGLYPAPARALVTIRGVEPGPETTFSLYTMAGELVVRQVVTGPSLKLTNLQGQVVPAGIYYYRILTGNRQAAGRLAIMR
jgi:hypothetical protein